MHDITITIAESDFAELERGARVCGRTAASVFAEWAEVLCEYPDDAMRLLGKLVDALPPPDAQEPGDELERLRRRAGISRRRRKRLDQPTVTINRAPGREMQDSSSGSVAPADAGGSVTATPVISSFGMNSSGSAA